MRQEQIKEIVWAEGRKHRKLLELHRHKMGNQENALSQGLLGWKDVRTI